MKSVPWKELFKASPLSLLCVIVVSFGIFSVAATSVFYGRFMQVGFDLHVYSCSAFVFRFQAFLLLIQPNVIPVAVVKNIKFPRWR